MSERRQREVRDGIERSLWAIYLQDRENELLKLIVFKLDELGWRTMAPIYDGAAVERTLRASSSTSRSTPSTS